MKKIKNILFFSCIRASELIEKKQHFKISLVEKLRLNIHKMMCDACSLYEKQTSFIEKGIELHQSKLMAETDMEELKQRIKNLLKDKKA